MITIRGKHGTFKRRTDKIKAYLPLTKIGKSFQEKKHSEDFPIIHIYEREK